jgi:hypothetical protein
MEIKQRCSRCQGTGSIDPYGDPPQTDCPDCGGDGLVEWGTQPDIIDKLDALQADMDIIKPQIQAIYDDLNP